MTRGRWTDVRADAGGPRLGRLVVGQPGAWLIARGEKTGEARSWTTPYCGPLVIVSAARLATPPGGMAV